MTQRDMNFIRAGFSRARATGMSMNDVWACLEHATDAQTFAIEIEVLSRVTPKPVNPWPTGGYGEGEI